MKQRKMKKATLNYWVDVAAGTAFLAAAVSGLVLLLAGSGGGYQGGRNPRYAASALSLSRWFWKDLHTWSAIVAIAGVLGHLLLHWSWMACMTRSLFRGDARRRAPEPCPAES